ncbi:MAG: glycosyltransferase family 39 protein [Deltaproteobacteria bacterium]|nr:glycosyltransferase family 39 protein [Deltaproteobacteria bacterium]
MIHIVILLILGGSLLFINLGNRPLGGSEGRWGEIAKEMLTTGDWIVPKINAFPYRDKPVGSYWLILLASLPGHQVTEWTTRLPSAAATLLSILLLYLIARAFWEPKAALFSALIFMTIFPLLRWGRTANADTLTIAGTLASLFFFVKSRHQPERGTWLYPFFIIAGLTSLMKGLLGFVLPSLAVFPYLFIKDRRIFLKKRFILHSFCGVVTGVALFLVPFILDYQLTHSDMSLYLLFKENIIRFFHPFDHKEPFYFYFYYVFITLSPWTLLLPFLIWTLKKNGIRNDEGVTFFSLWFVVIFVFFTLSGSKRGYYILPIAAPFSAILGFTIAQTLSLKSHPKTEVLLWLLPGCVSLLSGIVLLFLLLLQPKLFITYAPAWTFPYLYLLSVCLFIAGASIIATLKQKFTRAFIFFFSGFFLLLGTIFVLLSPASGKRNTLIPFCKKVNLLTKNSRIGVFHSADQSNLYFYLNEHPPLACLYEPRLAKEFLSFHRNSYLIVKGKDDLARLELSRYKIVFKEENKDSKAFYLITLPLEDGSDGTP